MYRKAFDLEFAARNGRQLWLDLGSVQNLGIARVRLNGDDLGVVWTPPFRVDITKALRAADNELGIEVVNSWRNRLVGDRELPEAERLTRTNITIHKGWKLRESGLLGPVRILAAE